MKTWLRTGRWAGFGLVWLLTMVVGGWRIVAQSVTTTSVQGTVYLANGAPGSGTLLVSWPAFTTAANQSVAAGSTAVTIGADGFLSVNLAPNAGATPAGEYYTAVFQLSDGSVSTQYWVVPAGATATLASVQAAQAVSKAYVDQAIAAISGGGGGTGGYVPLSGGTMTGPLTLSGDPTTPLMAADKHYVDESAASELSLAGGNILGPLNAESMNGVFAPEAGSAQSTLQATETAAASAGGSMMVPPNYTGTDTFTNTGAVRVEDMRATGAQQHAWSVKEFGAVCDGATDDTAALQAAINFVQAQAAAGHAVALTLPAGVCKTHQLTWHLESIGGQGVQASALMGFPGEDVLSTGTDATGLLSHTRLHDLTIYVDQSVDVSCSPAEGRAAAGSCGVNRPMVANSVLSPSGNGLTGIAGTGAAWSIGNCAIAMSAATGAGGNGLKAAEIENVAIATTGADPLAQYTQASSTHTCGLYLGQWPQASEFRNIDVRGVGTGVAVPALVSTVPAGLNADSNHWRNLTIQAVHGFAMAVGNNNVLDGVAVNAWNSAATGETPTGLVLDLAGVGTGAQSGWTVRNAAVLPEWVAVQPKLTVNAAGGAVTSVTVGPEHGLGFEAYGVSVPLAFSGSCTAAATAALNGDGSVGAVTVTAGGVGCSTTTVATVNAPGTWVPAKPVNLVAGKDLVFVGGNLLKGNGGYTVWNAASSRTIGMQLGGGGTLAASSATYPALVVGAGEEPTSVANGYTGSANRFEQLGLAPGALLDNGLGNTVAQTSASGYGQGNLEPARQAAGTVSADFALLGGGTVSGSGNQAFSSLNDLFFSAADLYSPTGETVAAGSLFGKDSTAPVTGSYVKALGGAWDTSGAWTLRGVGNSLVLGNGFPVGSGTWEVAAKADVAVTQELRLTGSTGSGSGGTSCVFADQTVSLTTSWQVFRIPYNTVTGNSACDLATQGNPVAAAALAPSVTTNVETAWVSFVPAFQQLLIANAPTAANQAANKQYVDSQVASQIVNGGGAPPIGGGTLTGALNAPEINGTTNCALASSVANCVSTSASALIPPGTASIASGGSYAQAPAMTATALCVYDPTQGVL
ncbi:glycoside hydrolase family 55 protein [Acidicapsa acidisoli]|uniref:glycoside hydrolase family 55 protein n=1 Tax=Acidicapsa acidisoli TaxID=1615681 RepID=UPI0021E07832|nr:glycoside hydrolase family 55 protein [Acidicapsa acidisoli]